MIQVVKLGTMVEGVEVGGGGWSWSRHISVSGQTAPLPPSDLLLSGLNLAPPPQLQYTEKYKSPEEDIIFHFGGQYLTTVCFLSPTYKYLKLTVIVTLTSLLSTWNAGLSYNLMRSRSVY